MKSFSGVGGGFGFFFISFLIFFTAVNCKNMKQRAAEKKIRINERYDAGGKMGEDGMKKK